MLLVLAHAACTSHTKYPAVNSPLIVAAAANLTEAFGEIGPRFTDKTGIRVVFSFGATADLAKQIENGAPFDVFASADTEHVDQLETKGLLTPGTRATYGPAWRTPRRSAGPAWKRTWRSSCRAR